jgi:uncharacterized coiled-coil protein SlyX
MKLIGSYLNNLLELDEIKQNNELMAERVSALEKKVADLEKINEDLSRSVAAIAIIQANLLKELQNLFSSAKKTTPRIFAQRKTDDYTN